MDIRDLRIGNVVRSAILRDDIYAEIASIPRQKSEQQVGLNVGNVAMGCLIYELIPVPLTETILPICGFELLDTDGENWDSSFDDPNDESKFAKVYGVNGLELAVSHTGEIYTIYRCVDNYYERADKKIEYLHDLQNYYYAMNKKELEVNL